MYCCKSMKNVPWAQITLLGAQIASLGELLPAAERLFAHAERCWDAEVRVITHTARSEALIVRGTGYDVGSVHYFAELGAIDPASGGLAPRVAKQRALNKVGHKNLLRFRADLLL